MADIDSMIPGIARFEQEFADDGGLFVVIGGAARELIYAEAALYEGTATRDLDVVLIAATSFALLPCFQKGRGSTCRSPSGKRLSVSWNRLTCRRGTT